MNTGTWWKWRTCAQGKLEGGGGGDEETTAWQGSHLPGEFSLNQWVYQSIHSAMWLNIQTPIVLHEDSRASQLCSLSVLEAWPSSQRSASLKWLCSSSWVTSWVLKAATSNLEEDRASGNAPPPHPTPWLLQLDSSLVSLDVIACMPELWLCRRLGMRMNVFCLSMGQGLDPNWKSVWVLAPANSRAALPPSWPPWHRVNWRATQSRFFQVVTELPGPRGRATRQLLEPASVGSWKTFEWCALPSGPGGSFKNCSRSRGLQVWWGVR